MILSTGADDADRKFDVCAALSRSQELLDLSCGGDGRFVYAIYNHSALDPGIICRATRFYRCNQNPTASKITKRIAQFLTQILQLYSKQFFDAGTTRFGRRRGAFKFALLHRHLLEAIDTITHDIGRNGETESLCGNALWCKCHLRRGDADQPPREMDHWSAAIARIDCRVGLHQIFVLGLIDGDVAFGCAQHAPADRAAVANGVAHYYHCLTE